MHKLKVSLGDPEAGWMLLTLCSGERVVEMYVSDIYPSLSMLAQSLLSLLTSQGEWAVTWTCEPEEYDMVFVRSGASISLSVVAFPDGRRSVFMRNGVLSATGSYGEICLPFWRALRGLQGRCTAEELAQRWTSEFPDEALNALTSALGKWPESHAG